MQKLFSIYLAPLLLLTLAAPCADSEAREKPPLRLVQTIPLLAVKGRMDHMDADVNRKRLFVSGLGNGSLEAVDLQAGKWMGSIPGFQEPQGVCYVPAVDKLFVASGKDGMLRIFRGGTVELLHAVHLDLGANRLAYDPLTAHIYVGYGGKDAGKAYGEIGIIDGRTGRHIGDIKVAAHPAEILTDKSGRTLFVAIYPANEIEVIDAGRHQVVSRWPVKGQGPGDMAFDEATHRLFVGTHNPPEMVVLDSRSGREVASLPTVEGMDGVFFDAPRKRVYVSGGRGFGTGFVYVYQQRDANHYSLIGKVPTRAGAGTSLWVPRLNRYYVAAPANSKEPAAILVFEPQP